MASNEPDIIVNGMRLSTAQAMTVRVALNAFAMDLQNEGMGDDEHGKAMTRGYLDRLQEIFALMVRSEQ